MPTVVEQISRFLANEPRLQDIVNANDATDVTLSDGSKLPSLRKFFKSMATTPPQGWLNAFANSPLKGAKGDPGGNAMSIGTLQQAAGVAIPNGFDIVIVSGFAAVGDDGAGMRLAYDPAVDANYVAANPTTSFRDTAGRGFRLAPDRGRRILTRLANLLAVDAFQDDRNAETVFLFDFLTNTMRAQIRAGSAPDITAAFQAALDEATGKNRAGDAVGGKRLLISSGRYIISDTLKGNFRFDNNIIDDGDLRRFSIEGEGSANTSIFYNGPTNKPMMQIFGNNNVDGRESHQIIKGLRFRRNFNARGLGVGLQLRYLAMIYFDDVHVDGFDLGIQATDVLGFYAYALNVLGHNVGLRAAVNDWTRPNVWHFWGGAFSGNGDIGVDMTEAANAGFYGTRFEGNGTGGAGDTSVLLQQAPSEGGAWAVFDNCYFEGTKGDTDIAIANGSAQPGVVTVRSCTFNRVGSGAVAKHHIDVYSGNGEVHVHVQGCGFKGFGSYQPDVSRSAVRNQSPLTVTLTHTANYFMYPQERIETNGGVCFNYNYLQTGAAGIVSNNGAAALIGGDNVNGSSIQRLEKGIVKVSFLKPFKVNQPAPFAFPIGAGSARIGVADYFASYVTFACYDANDALADMSFSFEVKGPIE